jgi:hypothetical protein
MFPVLGTQLPWHDLQGMPDRPVFRWRIERNRDDAKTPTILFTYHFPYYIFIIYCDRFISIINNIKQAAAHGMLWLMQR